MAQKSRSKSGGNPRGRPRKNTNTDAKNQNPGAKSNSRANTKVAPAKKIPENIEKTAENPNSIALNIAPVILFIIAVYILVTFFISGDGAAKNVGGVGVVVRNIFYGLLGAVAVLAFYAEEANIIVCYVMPK